MKDTIIIGAGISGLYTNYLMSLNNKSKSESDILILEGRDRTGGRIKSLHMEFSLGKNIVEAGATRISDKHNRVLKLLEDLNLTHELKKGYHTSSPLFNQIIKKCNKLPKSKLLGSTLFDLIKTDLLEVKISDLYEEFGYNSMIESLNAYDALNYVKRSYGAQFFTFKNGLSKIIERLEKNANIVFSTIVEEIIYNEENDYFTICTNKETYTCRKLIVSIPKEQLIKIKYLDQIVIHNNFKLNNLVSENPYIRLYFSFNESYKSVMDYFNSNQILISNSHIRQLIPISLEKNIFEIYCNGKEALYWRNSYSNGTVKEDIQKNMQKLFNDSSISLPDITYPFYWKSGTHFWLPNMDSEKLCKKIVKPLKNNLYIVGESFSQCQAWMEGSLQTVDLALDKMKEQDVKNNKNLNNKTVTNLFDECVKKSSKINLSRLKLTNLPIYNVTTVSEHNTKNDAWVIYNGYVYDITLWINKHPGGSIIMKGLGKDIGELFDYFNHSAYARKKLEKYKIGKIDFTD